MKKDSAFTEGFKKIALSSNDYKTMQSVDLIEAFTWNEQRCNM